MKYILAILSIIISYIILSGIIVGLIFNGNAARGGILTSLIMIPVAIFLWKIITRKRGEKNE